MISDKLFLAWNCPNCTRVKMHISDTMFRDDVIGKCGQTLTVIHTFSNNGTRDILDIFGLEEYYTPVLLTNDDKKITNPDDIINYLKEQNLTNQLK